MSDNDAITILIVEDQEITRIGLKLALERVDGLRVVGEAEDGETAVRKAKELSPNVVLMDLGLPVIDGISATKRIKTASPDIRVVILTTRDSDQDVFAAFAAGADGYALKEAPTERITMAIKAVADGIGWLDPPIANRVLQAVGQMSNSVKEPTNKQVVPTLLSVRELEVLALVVEGLSNLQIAQRLFVAPETIKTHMRHILEKLGVSDRTQAAVFALRQGLV